MAAARSMNAARSMAFMYVSALAILLQRISTVNAAAADCSVACGTPGKGCYEAGMCQSTLSVPSGQSCAAPSSWDSANKCKATWNLAGHFVSGFVWGSEASVARGYHFGLSYYTRVNRMFDRVPRQGQAGLFGQWIQDFNIHESESPFNSIEGGLFTHDKLGRSCYPKYMIGPATHLYNPNR
jgi:hypothetical protein